MDFNWIIQTATLLAVGVIAYFIKGTMAEIKDGIEKNDLKTKELEVRVTKDIEDLKDEIHDLKSDLPFIYVLREDFIRSLNNVDTKMHNMDGKLDKLLQIKANKGD